MLLRGLPHLERCCSNGVDHCQVPGSDHDDGGEVALLHMVLIYGLECHVTFSTSPCAFVGSPGRLFPPIRSLSPCFHHSTYALTLQPDIGCLLANKNFFRQSRKIFIGIKIARNKGRSEKPYGIRAVIHNDRKVLTEEGKYFTIPQWFTPYERSMLTCNASIPCC